MLLYACCNDAGDRAQRLNILNSATNSHRRPQPGDGFLFSGARMLEGLQFDHLKMLEAESIFILREAAAEFARPVMLYSIGKDSSVMLRLAQKAFYPGKLPFPLLHVDTSYKFPEMIRFRDWYTKEVGAELIVHKNQKALDEGEIGRAHV